MSESGHSRSLRLLDLAALIVGYGMAALLLRALWHTAGPPTTAEALFLGFEYVWLGLAMGGPLVLLIDRRAHPKPGGAPQYTWAELAWLLVGGYWLGLTLLVAPARLPVNPLLGVFPILGALALRLFSRRRPAEPVGTPPGWTHRVAIGLLITWPLAWADLILLSKSL